MSGETKLSAEAVQSLAVAAALPLDPERAEALVERLSIWFTGANELNEKMSAPEHRHRGPITNFTHPDPEVLE